MTDNEAIQKLQKQVEYIATLKGLSFDSRPFKIWHRDTIVVIEKIFAGDDARHKKEFVELNRPLIVACANNDANAKHQAYKNYLNSVEACLRSMIMEIKTKNLTTSFWKMVVKYIIAIIAIFGGGTLTWHFVWNKTTNINTPQTNSSGNYSPSNITTGPKSPVTNTYNFFGGEKNSKQSNGNKLQMTLRAICDDIDSRPLAQQDETAKKYIDMKMKIKKDCLRIHGVEINPGDPNIYNLELIFPDEPNSSSSEWIILCTVSKDIYPQLSIARKGNEVYVSGEVQTTFRRTGDLYKYVVLSDVELEFE